jgi:predicted metal-dependent peptidase
MDNNTSERIKQLIAKLVLKYNYWGYLFSRINRKENNNIKSIMALTPELNGNISLLYNKSMIDNTDDKNIIKVLEHEGLHLLNKHVSRLIKIISNETCNYNKQFKAKLWNIAADCTVNTQGKFNKYLIINGRKWYLCFPKYYNLKPNQITEKYYLDLLKQEKNKQQNNKEKQKIENNQQQNNKENNKEKQKIENNQQQHNKENNQQQNNKEKQKIENNQQQNNKEKQKNNTKQSSSQNLFNSNIDDHNNWINGCKSISDLNTLSNKIDYYTNRIIKESIKTFSKDRGELPGYISELITEALTPPQLPYYQIIKKLVKGYRFSKFKRSPTKINRKRTYSFVFADNKSIPQISPFPGKVRDNTFIIVVILDTSGSMKISEIKEGLTSIKNIIEKDKYCKTIVLEVDTKVVKEYICKKINDIEFNIKGRGGTTLGPGLFRAKELMCDICLVFTDGYTENINKYSKQKIPNKILWIVNNNGIVNNFNKIGVTIKLPK